MITYNTLIVLAGVGLLGAGCGLVGSYAVLRRQALLGDALAHAALPGLCLAFLVLGERNLSAMLLGALATGVLGIALISWLTRGTRVKQDAAIGIVLSVFFGAGIVLSRIIQGQSTSGSKAGLDSYILGKTAGMIASDVILIGAAAAGCALLVIVLFKELLLVSFDPGFARVQGWPARGIELLLTALIAVVVVIGLPAVGVVLIAALLIIPAAAARFWTDRLGRMVLLAAVFGAGMGIVGASLSATFEKMPAGPIITLVGTAVFVLSALAAPRRGLVARWLTRLTDVRRASYAGLLRRLAKGEPVLHAKLASAVRAGDATPDGLLTNAGRVRADEEVRRQRLWQLLIVEHPDLASLARPLTADAPEDVLPADIVADLTRKLQRAEAAP